MYIHLCICNLFFSFLCRQLVNFYEVCEDQKDYSGLFYLSEDLLQCFRHPSILFAKALTFLFFLFSPNWLCTGRVRRKCIVFISFCSNNFSPDFPLVSSTGNLHILVRICVLSNIYSKFVGPNRHTKYSRVQSCKGASRMGAARTRGSWWC